MSDDVVARLAAHRTIGSAPRRELEWLAAHGVLQHFAVGENLAKRGEQPTTMLVMLEGKGGMYVDRGVGRRKVTEWHGGDVTGVLPFSRMGPPSGDPLIDEAAIGLVVHRDEFPEMIRECPEITARLVHTMIDRVKHFASTDWQDDKMMSLGRLSAGLSHELNNPASAAARGAKQLGDVLSQLDGAVNSLAGVQLSSEQRSRIAALRERGGGDIAAVSPIERADREDELSAWLTQHQADDAAAATLSSMGITSQMLEELSKGLSADALDAAVRWIAAGHTARALASDVERATRRIHDLVSAVKRFTNMDRPTVSEPQNIAQSLADTVAVLAAKARAKSADVTLDVPADLPFVKVYGGELNQVWSNLLDNALDSLRENGHIAVTARQEQNCLVVVRVTDDGVGIPAEHLNRVFDPFFTTKPVGQGTGLGLDIARRIVHRHDGHINVESRPGGGRTEFRVSLPVL